MTPTSRQGGTRSAPVTLSAATAVSAREAIAVADLSDAATVADGVSPLDDQVRTELEFGASEGAEHILGRTDTRSTVIAYSHVVRQSDGVSAHLVVHPRHRRHGIGSVFVNHLLDAARGGDDGDSDGTLRIWAHGDTAGAQGLAAAHGFERVRDLWQMHRDLAVELPQPSYSEGVHVRTFEPGRDDEAWVALNAAAFASHPEQGRLTVDDLRHRIGQPWFDPEGFFLAERDGVLLGSHWTKVHSADETGGDPVGEVYAVGVSPDAQGEGLGKALTLTGLHHLRDSGLGGVMLYVDGDNAAAVRLYERLGFVTTTVDVMYATTVED